MMHGVARLLVGMGLLLLVDGIVNAVYAYPAGRFITAPDLTRAETSAVQRLTRSSGRKPWLIWGFRFGTDPKPGIDRARFDVYLHPDVENGRLRRGRLFTIDFGPARANAPSSWQVESVSKYAQVAVLGRPVSQVSGKWDIQRPFLAPADLDDQAIVSLVDFIRSSPEWTELARNLAPRQVDGSIPIISVRRFADRLEVCQQNQEWSGWYVDVESRDGHWKVQRIRMWIN
jgi:hypothetical protein